MDDSPPALAACTICHGNSWQLLESVARDGFCFDIRLCSRCGFVAQVPPLAASVIAAYYADQYNEKNYMAPLDHIHRTMLVPGQARMAFLERTGALESTARALEIGPGAGSLMSLLAERGIAVEGVEADPAAARYIADTLGYDVFHGEFDAAFLRHGTDWQKCPFELIALVHVFEHVRDPAAFLGVVAKILAPKGRLFLEVPNIRRPFSDQRSWTRFCDPGHLHYFSKASLARLLRNNGFAVVAITDDTMRPYQNIQCVANVAEKSEAVGVDIGTCDPPDDIARIWRRFVKFHPWRWYLRYGWKHDVKRLIKGT